ncbi:DUF3613 domain-containing protein [Photobacterium rosenbergii]|uniref:DUF3613 domain-containing protein n=1 Tax=Photobacterium rosenbergii TaxID=294936 RepID=A0ABU3ZF18_9GAMM|nr:DUF3613 domain-containing protein [Photobacterium rosenbergii]MDV5168686.1 DUF3613 domain-containing protein [Photobacterium rosenbergii]
MNISLILYIQWFWLLLAGVAFTCQVHAGLDPVGTNQEDKLAPSAVPSASSGDVSDWALGSEPAISNRPRQHNQALGNTRMWLKLQSGGQLATKHTDSLLPDAANKVEVRMLNSFSTPIPSRFISDSLGGG